jgi:hypothetical protein
MKLGTLLEETRKPFKVWFRALFRAGGNWPAAFEGRSNLVIGGGVSEAVEGANREAMLSFAVHHL